MEIVCSKTGSDGNFSFISDGQSYLAIDCGLRYAIANKKSGYKVLNSSGLLVTHFHS